MRVLKYYVENKHYLRHENKVNENEILSYCEALRYTINSTIKKQQKSCFPLCQVYKTNIILN